MIWILAGALFAAEAGPGMGDAVQALQAGRLEQARLIIDAAVKSGVHSEELDRMQADLAFRSGDDAAALARYETLAAVHPSEPLPFERAGIAALRLGDLPRATKALQAATLLPNASWRAWSARGALADRRHDWADADLAYGRALGLASDRPEILNNQGWSLLLRGEWAQALPLLERASALDPASRRMADNTELARAATAADLPRRLAGESDSDWAARLNDAGVLAATSGDRQRAIAAFAQAIEARSQWFERAANNLALVQGAE
jgi:tetratricopeptide (TPR) repeat protein